MTLLVNLSSYSCVITCLLQILLLCSVRHFHLCMPRHGSHTHPLVVRTYPIKQKRSGPWPMTEPRSKQCWPLSTLRIPIVCLSPFLVSCECIVPILCLATAKSKLYTQHVNQLIGLDVTLSINSRSRIQSKGNYNDAEIHMQSMMQVSTGSR